MTFVKTTLYMKNKFLIQLTVILFLVFACSKDDDANSGIEEENVDIDTISNIDTKLLSQIKSAGDLFTATQVWDGYNLKEYPLYLIHKNKEGNIDRGILINPQSIVEDAILLDEEVNSGLEAYRYDKDLERAWQLITDPDQGNGLYDFDFEIDGKGYYIQVYNDDEVIAGENLATYPGGFFDPSTVTIGAIDFIIHENFHTHQDNWLSNRNESGTRVNSRRSTIQSEILELKMLLHQIFKGFPNNDLNQEELTQKLKQYVAIQSSLGVAKFEPLTETGEGSARYIERMAIRDIFPNRANEPFIKGTVLEDDYGITNQETISLVFDFALTYEIGASVCFLLNKLDNEALKDVENGKTLYEIAVNEVDLSPQELEQSLQDAKNSVDWNAIQAKVQQLQSL